MDLKTIKVPRKRDGLHIELPGAVVNIYAHLTDNEGRRLIRVNVDADGDRYSGEPQWWCPDLPDPKGIGIRIVQMPREELPNLRLHFYDPHPGILGASRSLPVPFRIAALAFANGHHRLVDVLNGLRAVAKTELPRTMGYEVGVYWDKNRPGWGHVSIEEVDPEPTGWRVLRFKEIEE